MKNNIQKILIYIWLFKEKKELHIYRILYKLRIKFQLNPSKWSNNYCEEGMETTTSIRKRSDECNNVIYINIYIWKLCVGEKEDIDGFVPHKKVILL